MPTVHVFDHFRLLLEAGNVCGALDIAGPTCRETAAAPALRRLGAQRSRHGESRAAVHSNGETVGGKVDWNRTIREKLLAGGLSEMWPHIQQRQSWQWIIVALSLIPFVGFALWVIADHNVNTIWARIGGIIWFSLCAFLVANGIPRNR